MRWHWKYAWIALTILLLEIGIERFFKTGFIRYFMGDFLIVSLLYYVFRTILKKRKSLILVGVWIFAFGIEVLQLFDIPAWLGWENHRLIELTLGSSFDPLDLLAYFLGGLAAILLDLWLLERRKSSPQATK